MIFKNQKKIIENNKQFTIIDKFRGGGSTYAICVDAAMCLFTLKEKM